MQVLDQRLSESQASVQQGAALRAELAEKVHIASLSMSLSVSLFGSRLFDFAWH
jgi:hypothetical protein